MMPEWHQRPTGLALGGQEVARPGNKWRGSEESGGEFWAGAPGVGSRLSPPTCDILHFRCTSTSFQCQNL